MLNSGYSSFHYIYQHIQLFQKPEAKSNDKSICYLLIMVKILFNKLCTYIMITYYSQQKGLFTFFKQQLDNHEALSKLSLKKDKKTKNKKKNSKSSKKHIKTQIIPIRQQVPLKQVQNPQEDFLKQIFHNQRYGYKNRSQQKQELSIKQQGQIQKPIDKGKQIISKSEDFNSLIKNLKAKKASRSILTNRRNHEKSTQEIEIPQDYICHFKAKKINIIQDIEEQVKFSIRDRNKVQSNFNKILQTQMKQPTLNYSTHKLSQQKQLQNLLKMQSIQKSKISKKQVKLPNIQIGNSQKKVKTQADQQLQQMSWAKNRCKGFKSHNRLLKNASIQKKLSQKAKLGNPEKLISLDKGNLIDFQLQKMAEALIIRRRQKQYLGSIFHTKNKNNELQSSQQQELLIKKLGRI